MFITRISVHVLQFELVIKYPKQDQNNPITYSCYLLDYMHMNVVSQLDACSEIWFLLKLKTQVLVMQRGQYFVHGNAQHNRLGRSLRRNAAFISFSLCSSDLKDNDEPWPSLTSIESEGVQHFRSSLQVPWCSPKPRAY